MLPVELLQGRYLRGKSDTMTHFVAACQRQIDSFWWL